MLPFKQFCGSASDVRSTDTVSIAIRLDSAVNIRAALVVPWRDCWCRVDGLRSTRTVEQPHEPEARNSDTHKSVALVSGPPAESVVFLGCSAALGRALSVIS